MPDEIRDKCLKIIADAAQTASKEILVYFKKRQWPEKTEKIFAGSCELDVKELYQKYAKEPLEMDSFAMFNLVLQLEEEFKIEYHDFEELTFHMNELDDLVGYLVKLIQEKGDER